MQYFIQTVLIYTMYCVLFLFLLQFSYHFLVLTKTTVLFFVAAKENELDQSGDHLLPHAPAAWT